MGFIEPDEHLIFMDMQVRYEEPRVRLPADDIKKLVDSGIHTAMMFHTDWNWTEPEKGRLDWSFYDDRVQLLISCGMKVILQSLTFFPDWMPDDWMVRAPNGDVIKMPSMWHPEAWEYVKDYYRAISARFSSDKSMVANSWLTDGETLWPNSLAIFDPYAQALYRQKYQEPMFVGSPNTEAFIVESQCRMHTELQTILASSNRWNEVWTQLHPALAGYYGNGCGTIHEILGDLVANVPGVKINHLYCTWVQWGQLWQKMGQTAQMFGEDMWGGAEYAEGVIVSTDAAKANGLRGLLIGPCHPFSGHVNIEDWMTENIRRALSIWRANTV